MIHHLGHLVRRGEMSIAESNQVEGWLQLYGQETLIRYELESNQDTPLVGCRITFEPELIENGETELPSEIQAIQFGDLISLMIREVEPPMFDHTNIDLRVDGTYRCSLQLVWESHDGIIDVAIAPAQIDVQWTMPSCSKVIQSPNQSCRLSTVRRLIKGLNKSIRLTAKTMASI